MLLAAAVAVDPVMMGRRPTMAASYNKFSVCSDSAIVVNDIVSVAIAPVHTTTEAKQMLGNLPSWG
jgi:hypothetical protein